MKEVRIVIAVLMVIAYAVIAFGGFFIHIGDTIVSNKIGVSQANDSDVNFVETQVWIQRQRLFDIFGGLFILILITSVIVANGREGRSIQDNTRDYTKE